VTPARALILNCSVHAVSACGSARSEQSADPGPVAPLPGPPIQAIDEPFTDLWWVDTGDRGASGEIYLCGQRDSKTTTNEDCKPTPEMKERIRRQEKELERAAAPAKGSEPRAVARLRLDERGSRVDLIAWKSQSGELCLADDEMIQMGDGDSAGGGDGPFGPCMPDEGCGDICLTFSGSGSPTEWLTAGVFPAKADLLRITFDGGREATYELDGPLVPSFPQYRVFMLELGGAIETRLELFEGEKRIAEEKRSDSEIRMMRCNDRLPPSATLGADPNESSLHDCLQKTGEAE
jgi:hypothetical protein